MKRILALAACAAVAVPNSAFAAKYRLDITAAGEQKARMNSGVEAVDDNLPGSSARILESEEPVRKRGVLMMYVLNAGNEPLNIGPENVSIEAEGGTAIPVIPYEKLLKEEKSRQTWAAVAAGLSAMSNSLNAATAGHSYGTVNAYGSRGWATASYSAYNPAAASMATSLANAQNQQMFDRLAESNSVSLDALKVNMRTTTVDPGHDFGGQVTFEVPPALRKSKAPVPVRIRVAMGTEVHVFAGALVPTK